MTLDADDGGEPDTWTRTELLAARGYPVATVNGHGDHEGQAVEPVGGIEAVDTRTCAGCGVSLAGRSPSARWCSGACRARAVRAARPVASVTALDLAAPHTDTDAPADGLRQLVAIARAVCAAGLAVTIVVDGVEVRVTV